MPPDRFLAAGAQADVRRVVCRVTFFAEAEIVKDEKPWNWTNDTPDTSADNIVVSEGRLTAMIGVRDLVVVNASGATLVCHKSRVQDIKAMVKRLESSGRHGDVL
jgi:hypothetical protein